MIKKHWWKALGVLLLIYTFVAGMLVPLKPGILGVSPASIRTGDEVTILVNGYNSNFTKGQDTLRAWLKMDNEKALEAKSIRVKNDTQLEADFSIPEYLPVGEKVQNFAIVIDNAVDGAAVRPDAVFVTQDSIDPEMGNAVWKNNPIDRLHDKAAMDFRFGIFFMRRSGTPTFMSHCGLPCSLSLWLQLFIVFGIYGILI